MIGLVLLILLGGTVQSWAGVERCERKERICEQTCRETYAPGTSRLEGCLLRCRTEKVVCEAGEVLNKLQKDIKGFFEGFTGRGGEKRI